MNKFLKFTSLLIVLALIVLINPLSINASENYCYNLKASVGENATSVGINWHSSVSGSKLLVSKNSDMSNYQTYTPEERLYSKGMTNDQEITIFKERTICTVNLTDLELNTKYYYQVSYESYKSEISTFKTAKNTKTTFGVLCDTQASGTNFKYSDQLISKLSSINSDINFFMIAGDIVDRGGYESEWNNFETYMPILNHQFLQATIPGNHELYHSSRSEYVDATIYNQYYNNPKNGCAERLNSSYYFKYNDTLFIMLDTMTRSSGKNYYDEQIAWFGNVVQNNPSSFIIVVTHPGCYSTGVYDSDASIMNGKWRETFEEYGVSLAISGHEHLYARTAPLYDNKKDEEKGVTYVIGGSAGAKSYSAKNKDEFEVVLETPSANGQYCGSIIEIIDDTLTFSYYDINGNKRDSFEIKSKASIDKNFNVDTFLENVKVEFNVSTYKNSIVWPSNAFGNIKNISVYVEHLDLTVDKYIAPNASEINVGNGNPSRDYKYICTFTDYEGNIYTKTLEVNNEPELLYPKDFKLTITETENNNYSVECSFDTNKCKILFLYFYLDGEKYTFDKEYKLTFESDKDITEENISLSAFINLYGVTSMVDVTEKIIELEIDNLEGTDPDNTTNGDKPSGNSCNFGISYVSSFILLAAICILLNKRK